MLQLTNGAPRRILMSLDAVGGVWRYALTLAGGMRAHAIETAFIGFGPRPSPEKMRQATAIGPVTWVDLPLDWMARTPDELAGVPEAIAAVAEREAPDLIHLNLPSQAAGLALDRPVLVTSHSCVTSWFLAVRASGLPADWAWQAELNAAGLSRADGVVSPSRAHAALLTSCYGTLERLSVVPNAVSPAPAAADKSLPFVLAVGRWWDEGKNAAVLDLAARETAWPVLAAGTVEGPAGQSFSFQHVRALGERDYGTVRGLAAQAPILVSPSIYEPFGLAALEAAEAGAALVLSDIPTYRELWDGAALFARPDDPADFTTAINRLAEDGVRRAVLASRARERAKRYAPDMQAIAMLDVYAAAMAHGHLRLVRGQ